MSQRKKVCSMASARTINAPGIELREIDRSKYGFQDNSLPNAPVVLVTGVASKGENYVPQWINAKSTFIDKLGAPSTEEERYLYNACTEIIDRGGVCIVAKLPYDNVESQGGGTFTYCDYKIDPQVLKVQDSAVMSAVNAIDSTLTSYLKIQSREYTTRGTMSMEDLDNLRTGEKASILNQIKIVDISRSRYTRADFPCVTTVTDLSAQATNDALGIFPVIVSPTDAMYFQGLFDSSSISVSQQDFNPVSQLSCIKPAQEGSLSPIEDGVVVDLSQLSSNLFMKLSDISSQYEETVSKTAALQFPLIGFKDYDHLDTRYLKQIGVVVFRAYTDASNSNKVNFEILETFVGSLDKSARSPVDNSSIFIDNIVNNNSQYINLFSNINQNILKQVSLVHIDNQTSKMLGFFEKDCEKNINVNLTLIDGLTKVLEKCKDPNQLPLDLVVDAGVSNIAQYHHALDQWISSGRKKDDFVWKLSSVKGMFEEETVKWRQVIKKFDDFCHYTRQDCMFIADGLRPFCLIGEQKIVRPTKIGSSVTKDIVPFIRHISGINSSYSAGYCDWFQQADAYTGDFFWCPPSIKASSIFIYCDTYFHSWDAPAGMTRGIVPNVVDVAFSPNKDDAGKIYLQGWNYAISYPLDGIIMEGQKTFQTSMTALDRINVRRLLLKLEKQVIRAAKFFLYEGNTEYLRQKFVDTIRPFFEQAVSGNGIIEYAIKCDNEINTQQVIDNNELRCKIAIKPVKTIEYIVITFVTTSQTASVTEEVKK